MMFSIFLCVLTEWFLVEQCEELPSQIGPRAD